MTRRPGSPVRGASILEVLLAASILGMGLLPLAVLLKGSLSQIRASRPELLAAFLATETMDQLRLVPYRDLPFGSRALIDVAPGPPFEWTLAGTGRGCEHPFVFGSYPIPLRIEIEAVEVRGPAVLAKVTVTVRWKKARADGTDPGCFVVTELVENRVRIGGP